nr:MAG TPA: hypothetical protein [Caudoviricetes sp.]
MPEGSKLRETHCKTVVQTAQKKLFIERNDKK